MAPQSIKHRYFFNLRKDATVTEIVSLFATFTSITILSYIIRSKQHRLIFGFWAYLYRGRMKLFTSAFTLLSFVLPWMLVTNIFLVLSIHSWEEKDSSSSSKNRQSQVSSPMPNDNNRELMSLAESNNRSTKKKRKNIERANTSQDQWERALKEIKNLAVPRSSLDANKSIRNVSLFRRWRLLLDEPTKVELDPKTNTTIATVERNMNSSSTSHVKGKKATPRFDGFASWERMLQDWAYDVQDYIDKIEENKGYPMSQYGNSEKNLPFSIDSKVKADDSKVDTALKSNSRENSQQMHHLKKNPIRLPVPSPKKEEEGVVPDTDISDKSKRILIVTTASLPWMTGTAVNPLLRAAYMTNGRNKVDGSVTLMLPWLERRHDQEQVYGINRIFENPEEQETYIREWLRDSAKLPAASEELRIKWYNAWQSKSQNSVYSTGDITALIPEEEVDICILEEPEHLNWYRAPGDSWTDKFNHVVGIIHTNYFVYAQDQPAAFVRAPAMRLLCSWMCRAHCHRIIKLSGTLGQFAPEKELIENVHGIRGSFLDAGKEVSKRIQASPKNDPVFGDEAESSVYFIGKMLWSKGLGSLMELLKYAHESAGIKIHVDMYGGGPDKDAAEARANSLGVDMDFHGPIDHPELAFTHKIFINPSTSEVLCTTVAEALGMGKFVVVPSHPSNDFFAEFPNCLVYTNKEEFVGNLYYALTHSPEPLTEEYSHALSWEAATQRLEAAGSIPTKEAEMMAEALSSSDSGIEVC
mmetsp:Transcript_12657/g.13570  ORF Transcript_12657/g.13570 Transcript_12657/m.13570 type:complete len:754 (-) Transcript_12657:839-3100(-)